ncbi:MAG TPA: ferredoxin--NADP reductase [Acidimicrobiales bacterium]|jgi:ferredoxin-NADP reductase|nr:ferredoxin--NADP reductase [Acidimicrobiales bacterium]
MTEHADIKREHGYHPLRVKDVVQETADTRSFVLDVPDDLAALFRYEAGQFCTFRVRLGDDEHLRSYSMSSAPETDADLTVTVKRVPGGLISNWFNDHVDVGDTLEVTRPAGVFCVQEGDRPLVALCGGSGITPVVSIVKRVLTTTDRRVKVLYANRDGQSVIFGELLANLTATHPARLRVEHHLDTERGLVDGSEITSLVGPDLDTDFYVCGPTPFMDLVEGTLLAAGVAADRIAIERFAATVVSTLPAAGSTLVAEPAPEPVSSSDAGAGAAPQVPAELTIILKGKRHVVAYHAPDTVLETARRGGLAAPFSCEAGNCATCIAQQHDGSATMHANNALSDDEVADGWILTCQAVPEGPTVTVEYESF